MILQAAGGYLNTGITIAHGLLLIPLYVHFIGAKMYGFWLASGGILGVMGLLNFGIGSLMIQRVARSYGQRNLDQAGAYFISGLAVYICISLVYALAGGIASLLVPGLLDVPISSSNLLRQAFLVAVMASVVAILNECLRGFSQALLKPVFPMLSLAASKLLGLLGTVLLLMHGVGLWALPLGLLITEGSAFILNMVNVARLFAALCSRPNLNVRMIKEYVGASPALVASSLGTIAAQESQPLLITIILGAETTTAYMITRRAADIVFQLLNVVVGSSMGTFAHLAGEGNVSKTAAVVDRLLVIAASLGLIGFASYVALNSAFVTLWVKEVTSLTSATVLVIAVGLLLRSLRGLVSQLLFGLGDFVLPSMIILCEGILGVILSVVLLRTIGISGVPLGLVLASALAIIIMILRLKVYLPSVIKPRAVLRFALTATVLFGGALGLLVLSATIQSWLQFVVYGGFVFGLITIAFVALNPRVAKEFVDGVYRPQ